MRRPLLLAAMLVTVAVAGSACDPRAPAGNVQALTFVGSAACAGCHERETAAFQSSDHARAMQTPSESTVLGDFAGSRFGHGAGTYEFFRRDGKYLVRTAGADGRPAEVEVTHTFGADPLQQYLVGLPDGRLQALGVAWDTRPKAQGGQRWFHLYDTPAPAPGDPLHWTGRDQTWNYQCAECHSTDLRKGYDVTADRYATTWAELTVACEACHGPGSGHVAWASARRPGTTVRTDEPTGFPVRLGRSSSGRWVMKDPGRGIAEWDGPAPGENELNVCARCHARRRPIADPYTHGQPLLDTHAPALLTEGLYHPDGQILGEVYEYGSFIQSRMHRAGVTCSDCHEPHAARLRAPGDAVCARCHLPARFDTPDHHRHAIGSQGARCVACHMPERTYMGVDSRRDHSFRVPRPDLSVSLDTPNACTSCHSGRSARWAAETVAGWRGPDRAPRPHFAPALDAGRRGLLDAEQRLAALISDHDQPAIARATALSLLPEFRTAVSLPAITASLGDRDPLVRSAAVTAIESMAPEYRSAFIARALADPVRAVRIAAARALAGARQEALTPEQRSNFERALAELIAAEMVDADRPEAHVNVANVYAQLGRAGDAEAALRTALRIDPRSVPALVNLADLYRALGRDADAARSLEEALAGAPANAAALHALGLLRVRQGRHDEALALLQRAAALEPDTPRFAYVHAIALHSRGDAAAALAVLEAALRRRPASPDVLSALLSISRERGDHRAALRYAEALVRLRPDDASVRMVREDLRRRTTESDQDSGRRQGRSR